MCFLLVFDASQRDHFVIRGKTTFKNEMVNINYNANALVGIVGDKTTQIRG